MRKQIVIFLSLSFLIPQSFAGFITDSTSYQNYKNSVKTIQKHNFNSQDIREKFQKEVSERCPNSFIISGYYYNNDGLKVSKSYKIDDSCMHPEWRIDPKCNRSSYHRGVIVLDDACIYQKWNQKIVCTSKFYPTGNTIPAFWDISRTERDWKNDIPSSWDTYDRDKHWKNDIPSSWDTYDRDKHWKNDIPSSWDTYDRDKHWKNDIPSSWDTYDRDKYWRNNLPSHWNTGNTQAQRDEIRYWEGPNSHYIQGGQVHIR